MNEYWTILQSVTRSIDEVVDNSDASPDAQEIAGKLSILINPCINEIQESALRLDRLIEKCSQDLMQREKLWLDYIENLKTVSSSSTIEKIGRLSGQKLFINQYIRQSKEDVIEQIVDYWKDKLKFLDDKLFLNSEGKIKKGIGWNEKFSFQKEIKKLHEDVVKRIEKSSKLSFALIYESSDILMQTDVELEEFCHCIKILDEVLQIKYQNELESIIEIILKTEEIYLPTESIISALNPIINCAVGDLYRDVVAQTSLDYIKSIESYISAIFSITVRPIYLFLETLIKFYNSVLEKQISYEQESTEQQQKKSKLIKEQLEKLNTIQASLKEILL